METANLKLYDFARKKMNLSDADAKEFVTVFDEAVMLDIKQSQQEFKSILKDDFIALRREIYSVKDEIIKWIFGMFIAIMLMGLGIFLKK